jgi:Fe-S-cluster containining protein
MNLTPERLLTIRHRYLPLLNRLATLFGEMNQAYTVVAGQYGFHCNGCADNCCLTRFYHHTLLEYLYLVEGLRTLGPDVRHTLYEHALTVSARIEDADRRGEALRIMCPLNHKEKCLLYPYRPMICRLHGIPHELQLPGGDRIKNPGCDAFLNQCHQRGQTEYIRFDRTLFYRQMAALEQELRKETGYTHKIKLTIAQMLVAITDSDHEID